MLGKLARQVDPNVLVGFDHADDAGVYQISPEMALVQTVDFFTPIVDDPYTFGQIAAVNALSDVYAMGGRPLSSLALVCFPEKADLEVLEQILAGGLAKMMEAGCTVIGGHSIRDEEIKFGYAVTGTIHPQRVLANKGAKPGDRLVLTKALGTGVISTAIKKDKAQPEWVEAATHSMTTLNKTASEVVVAASSAVHALTDITGFGLIGHATELADASGVTLEIEAAAVPLLDGAIELSRAGFVTRAAATNLNYVESRLENRSKAEPALFDLLIDAQTSGGLLIAMPESGVERYVAEMERAGAADGWTRIGSVLARSGQIGVRLV